MKKSLLILLALIGFGLSAGAQDAITIPEGAQIQSLRNDGKSELYIRGCDDGLRLDDMNNLYGDYWRFYLVGTVNSLLDVTVKPYATTQKIALRKGCGYVARYNNGGGDIFVRIYITEMVVNKSDEIIGATILYQTGYLSRDEIERARVEREEREASKIFWNGDAVSYPLLRKTLLAKFDSDNDGKISRLEASKETSLVINTKENMRIDQTGIRNLTGLTSLIFNKANIYGEIILALPNLRRFTIVDNEHGVKSIDLSGCVNLDTVTISKLSIDNINLRNCKKLRHLEFTSQYYSYINEQLNISGCTALEEIISYFCVRGKVLNASGCTSLTSFYTMEFNEINLSGCSNLERFFWDKVGTDGYTLSKINLDRCFKLESIHLRNSKVNELKLSDCKELSSFELDSSAVKNLDLSDMKHLYQLSCYNGDLKTLNVSGCDSLRFIFCNDNKIESINLTNCRNLTELFCHRNNLRALDVSDCDSLKILCCYRNPQLTALDVTHNLKLEWIQCSNTAIQELDISRSETTEWADSEWGEPIKVPGALQGFKTLWINENQKVEFYEYEDSVYKSVFKPMKDKNFDRTKLLVKRWDESRQEYVNEFSQKDLKANLDFKIKVRN